MKQAIHLVILFAVLAFAGCDGGRRQQMEALLDRADSLNRAYVPMTGGLDSLLLEAARYYDRHGTANEQVRAHYLLGCAHRDMGEAPAALQCYQDAVDRAERLRVGDGTSGITLSPDCDYQRLMAVYGQMAELFDAQNLPEDELSTRETYMQYAKQEGDILRYLRGYEMLAKPYYSLGDTVRVLNVLVEVGRLYEKHGYHTAAIRTYGLQIPIYLKRGNLSLARELMQRYEQESGLFQPNGDIAKGREVYYDFKGTYFLQTGCLDSAEYYMRKLKCFAKYQANASRGLMAVYRVKAVTDSVVLYARLYEQAIDADNAQKRTEAIHQMSSVYNYQRFQKKADAEAVATAEVKVQRNRYALLLLIVVFALAWVYHLYRSMGRKRQETLREYEQNLWQLRKLRAELLLLQQHEHDYQDMIAERKSEIALLESRLTNQEAAEGLLRETAIYKHLHSLSLKGSLPTTDDWRQLGEAVKNYMPELYSFLEQNRYRLNHHEYLVSLLTRIHIKPKAIANMLGISSSYVTKIRLELSKKLFNGSGKASDFDNRIREFC